MEILGKKEAEPKAPTQSTLSSRFRDAVLCEYASVTCDRVEKGFAVPAAAVAPETSKKS